MSGASRSRFRSRSSRTRSTRRRKLGRGERIQTSSTTSDMTGALTSLRGNSRRFSPPIFARASGRCDETEIRRRHRDGDWSRFHGGSADRIEKNRSAATRSERTRARGHSGARRIRSRSHRAGHTHYGEEVIYVLEGTLRYDIDGQGQKTARPGDVLFVPAGTAHSATNIGSGKGAELATYIVEKGKPLTTLVK